MESIDISKLATIEGACKAFPKRIAVLFEALDLARPGLEAVRKATERDDQIAACEALLAYYRKCDSGKWLRSPKSEADEKTLKAAESILGDTYTLNDQTSRVPRKAGGGLDWDYRGPTGDIEWAFVLNRHFYLLALLRAYLASGRGEFADRIDQDVRDWAAASHPYPGVHNGIPMWRGLEVALRARAWAQLFFGLQNDERLRPGTRLLMLACLPEHAHYNRNFHAGGNWMTMELTGLATVAGAFPEFRESKSWIGYAKQTLSADLQNQVYPDGVQTELTCHYHWAALSNSAMLADVCRETNEPLPESYERTLELMYNYVAYASAPDGGIPMNNDSDRINLRAAVVKAAEHYKRPDWVYMCGGSGGKAPEGEPSAVYPWAGQLVSRSGWDAQAHWSFFDFGPWGTGHQHNDKLHLSIHAHGRDLLVDSGRFSYTGDIANRFRASYALHSRGHNLVLIDGCGQGPGEPKATRPAAESDYLITPALDFARGSFEGFDKIEGTARHTRAVLYVRGKYWIVLDRIETDRPRRIEALWHFHPKCTVSIDNDGSIVTTDVETGNLRVVSSDHKQWNTETVRGQEKPSVQGWYSERYNIVVDSPTAVCGTSIGGDAVFAWLLVPAYCQVPRASLRLIDAKIDQVRLEATIADEKFAAVVPLTGSERPSLS